MTRNYEPFDGWYETTIDDAKTVAALMGWNLDDVYFSGFWSQGDGACFTGGMGYAKGCAKAVTEYAPLDAEIQRIAAAWQELQRRNFYKLEAGLKHTGRYNHEFSVSYRWYAGGYDAGDSDEGEELARDFMRWIYRNLEREYEYQSAWTRAQAWSEAAATAATEKAAARQLIRDMREARRKGGEAAPSICTALRRTVRQHLAEAVEALEERAELAADFWYREDGKTQSIEEFAAANI
jgi:hypothetical protein